MTELNVIIEVYIDSFLPCEIQSNFAHNEIEEKLAYKSMKFINYS